MTDYSNIFSKSHYTLRFQELLTTKEKTILEVCEDIKKNGSIQETIGSSLAIQIKNLPKEAQYKIYIFCMKNYWKRDTLERSLLPRWNTHYQSIVKETKKATVDNVHFLHLEYNIIPENKKYIMGCQCDFCQEELHTNEVGYNKHLKEYITDNDYFLRHIGCNNAFVNDWNLYSNIYLPVDNDGPHVNSMIIYEPMYDIIKEQFALTNDFSDETKEVYKEVPEKKPLKFES